MNPSRKAVLILCVALIGTIGIVGNGFAYDAEQLDAKVAVSLEEFGDEFKNSQDVIDNSVGILVCPKISKVGLGVGLERGACALQIDGKTHEYYRAASASAGLTAGIQSYTQIMAFNEQDALDKFRNRRAEWEVGVDGSVAVATKGAGATINTSTLANPIVAIVFGQKGLMGDLSIAGSRYKKIGTAADVEKYGIPLHRFVVTADISDLQGSNAQTAQMTIDIDDWITDAERARLISLMREQGAVDVHNVLAEWGLAGLVKQPGDNTEMQYAYAVDRGEDAEYRYRVVMVSTNPMGFASAKQIAKRVEDNFTVVQLDLTEKHVGTGVIVMGPKVGWDEDKDRVTIDQRTLNPIELTSVSYKKID
jgi:lipid-binding SYLF domain-containing protein